MHVNKMAGETFDAILDLFPKIIPDAKKLIQMDGGLLLVLTENLK